MEETCTRQEEMPPGLQPIKFCQRSSTVLQWGKLLPVTPTSYLDTLLPVQLPANAHRKAAKDARSVWVPAAHMGHPGGVRISRLIWPNANSWLVDIWRE